MYVRTTILMINDYLDLNQVCRPRMTLLYLYLNLSFFKNLGIFSFKKTPHRSIRSTFHIKCQDHVVTFFFYLFINEGRTNVDAIHYVFTSTQLCRQIGNQYGL